VTTSRRALRKSLKTNFTPTLRERLSHARTRALQVVRLPELLLGRDLNGPVFVIGAPRSGTSLLFTILRASSELAHWPGEAHEIWEADYHPALRDWDSNALGAADVETKAAQRIRRNFLLVTGSRRRLIDKTPRNSLRVPWVDAMFSDARYVFLQRDGRDNVNSLINAWRTPRYRTYELPEPHRIPGVDGRWWKFVLYPGWREDLEAPVEVVCAHQWVACNEYALNALERMDADKWTTIRYEDLVDRPVEEVGRVVEFLGLPYEHSVRDRAAAAASTPINVVTPPELGKWRRENPAEIARIRPLIEPTMARLGYSFD
jgi:Sulfotransferase family